VSKPGGETCRPTSIVVEKCGKSFERTETITEHEAAKARCPKCNSKKVTPSSGSRQRRDIQEELGSSIPFGASLSLPTSDSKRPSTMKGGPCGLLDVAVYPGCFFE
jgi:hypothetical protein